MEREIGSLNKLEKFGQFIDLFVLYHLKCCQHNDCTICKYTICHVYVY